MRGRHPNDFHAASTRRFESHVSVFENHAAGRQNAKFLCAEQENFGVRLAVRDILAGDNGAEQIP